MPFVKQGSLRALAVTTPQRLLFLPQLPTVAESGLPRYQSGNWYGIMVPVKTPRETVARVRDAVVAALNEPGVKKRLSEIAYVPIGDASEVFAAFVKSEIGDLGKLVQQFKLTAD
jgi:tripartite-type tricarboxylate transporter receptor subunit TctC